MNMYVRVHSRPSSGSTKELTAELLNKTYTIKQQLEAMTIVMNICKTQFFEENINRFFLHENLRLHSFQT
jgi:hypothetical protein